MRRQVQAGIFVGVVVLAAAAAAFVFLRNPASAPPVAGSGSGAGSTAPAEDGSVRYPVPPPEASPDEPLPSLEASDAFARALLERLFGGEALARILRTDQILPRFVATVDNLPRATASQQAMPVEPVEGAFLVSSPGEGPVTLHPDNHARYRPYVQLVEAVPPKVLVSAYVRIYPLLQAAYVDLGYPDGYFNDRLVAAIDDLLAAPDVADPVLEQANVLYRFADPALEARSSGQKIMLRMGRDNAVRVKVRLRAIRGELVGRAPDVP